MIRPIDSGDLFAEAWKAARARHSAHEQAILGELQQSLREASAVSGSTGASAFEAKLDHAAGPVLDVDHSVRAVDELPAKLVTGEIKDFHELAGQLKRSELTFKFALEVRNKLIDAYREVMRMSV